MSLEDLLATRRVERVPEDPAAANRRLAAAQLHLVTAAAIVADDPDAAYAVLYDAARKAVSAHMLAAGLRVRNAPGAHAVVATYAADVIGTSSARELDRMRRFRNRIEYGTTRFATAQVEHDLEHARGIVADVARTLAR